MHVNLRLRSRDGLEIFVQEWRPVDGVEAGRDSGAGTGDEGSVNRDGRGAVQAGGGVESSGEAGRGVKGLVCILHGHGEQGSRHDALARTLAAAGFVALAPDLRGHGRSGGRRGHTPTYEHLLDDVDTVLEHVTRQYPNVPRFLYGHSFGGNIALNHALRRPEMGLAGVVATSPWLRLTHEISMLRVALATTVEPIWPSFSVSTSIDKPKLELGPYEDDPRNRHPLNHDRITMRTFLGLRRAGRWALEHAHLLTIPALIVHGDRDDVSDSEASNAFATASNGQCRFHLLPDQYHNFHLDQRPKVYVGLLLRWLEENAGAPKAEGLTRRADSDVTVG